MIELKKHTGLILELGKVKITFFVAVSTSIGYLLNSGKLEWQILLPAFGVFVLAMGSSAFNHYQERFTDALMDRTKGRPIPSGRINSRYAIIAASSMALVGSLVLYFSSGVAAMLLGFLALVWYNIVYTPLKKKYAMAVIPGSLIGAIPPVIGWVASGGAVLDPKILSVALFFFIWQIPHFWLLLLLYGKDYEQAGFPTLTQKFSNLQLSRMTFVWMTALTTSCAMIPFINVSGHLITAVVIVALGVWLLIDSRDILSEYIERISFRKAFVRINLYVLAVVLVLSLDKLFLKEF